MTDRLRLISPDEKPQRKSSLDAMTQELATELLTKFSQSKIATRAVFKVIELVAGRKAKRKANILQFPTERTSRRDLLF